MGGPIVRTGTNPKFWNGWDKVFGGKPAKTEGKAKSTGKKATVKKVTAKKAKKSK
ncbi:MAG: hypothetical protein ACKVT0_08990 [Planctomycetaceae bacterium]